MNKLQNGKKEKAKRAEMTPQMSNINDPMVKMFMKNKKVWLVTMAKERDIECHGNKIDLAMRLAEFDYKRFSRDWDTISKEY